MINTAVLFAGLVAAVIGGIIVFIKLVKGHVD